MPPKDPERGRFIAMTDGEVIDGTDFEISDEEKAFADFRNSLEAGEEMASVRVSKIPKNNVTGHPTNAKSIYCFAYPVDQHTFESLCEFIRDNYGGGLYRLIGTRKGKKGSAFNQILEIAEPMQKKNNEPPGQNPGSVFDSVARLLGESQQRTEEMLMRMSAARPAGVPAADPAAMMAQTMQLFTGMIGALAPIFGGAKAAPAGDFMSEIQKYAAIKSLFDGLKGDGGGMSDKESNFYDVVTQGMKTFAPLIANALPGAIPGAAPAYPQLTAPAGAPTIPAAPFAGVPTANGAPVAPAAGASPLSAEDMRIKEQVDLLVSNARAGANPDSLADVIFRMTPDDKLEQLDGFIRGAHVIEHMAFLNPEVRQFHSFFQALRESLIRILDEATEPEANSAGAPAVQPAA
jgi:hypothetical protein